MQLKSLVWVKLKMLWLSSQHLKPLGQEDALKMDDTLNISFSLYQSTKLHCSQTTLRKDFLLSALKQNHGYILLYVRMPHHALSRTVIILQSASAVHSNTQLTVNKTAYKHVMLGQIHYISFSYWSVMTNAIEWQVQYLLCVLIKCNTQPFICPAYVLPPSSSLCLPLSALYLSAIRQIVAGLICITSSTVPIGAPHSCLLKDSGATAPSHSPIPWIKLTLGQHQHIMNYGHLPPQTHCSLWSNVRNIEGTGKLGPLTAYSLSYLLCGVCLWKVDGRTTLRCKGVDHAIGLCYLSCILTFV